MPFDSKTYRRWEVGEKVHADFLIAKEAAEALITPEDGLPNTATRFTLYQKQGVTYLQALNEENCLQAQYEVKNIELKEASDFESDIQTEIASFREKRAKLGKQLFCMATLTIAFTVLAMLILFQF